MYSEHAASFIFTPVRSLPEALNKPRLRQEILQQIYDDPETLFKFHQLSIHEQEALLDFCVGNRGLKITFDPFFQNIFHPFKHPDRLNRLLSSILKQPVKVKGVLPREGIRLTSEASFVVMDVLVELQDGTLITLEMQKIGYQFPIARSFCYSADLLMRQYDRTRASLGDKFNYRDMRPVYIIIFMESSPSIFSQHPDTYLHRSEFKLNSDIEMENLINFIYIPLDIFSKIPHNELTELDAWLYFLSSDNPAHVQHIIEKYPFFQELYEDIINFRYHPKELITMYSESLQIADRNTIKLMIDEMRDQMIELNDTLAAKGSELSAMRMELFEKKAELSEKNAELSEKNAEISVKNAEISVKNAELSEKNAEIEQLKKQLAALNK